MLSPLSSFSRISSSPSQAAASKPQKIPISLSQLYKDIQTLPEEIRDQLIPKDDLFMELNKPTYVSPWQKASAALKKLNLRHPFGTTLKNMASAWNNPPKQRLNSIKTILLASSSRFDKRNNEYLKEALRTGNQPLFLMLLKKAENPDLAPLIKCAVIDGNEAAFSEIIKKVNQPLPKEAMNWLAEYGKSAKLAILLGQLPAGSYTSEALRTWMSLAESQRVKIEQAKKQAGITPYTKVVEAIRHIHHKIDITRSLHSLTVADHPIADDLQNQLNSLEEHDAENRRNFMAYSQCINIPTFLKQQYFRTLKGVIEINDQASLEWLLNIPNFRKVASSASNLPVIAARTGHLEGLQLLLDMPGMGVNQMYNSQNSLHAAAEKGHAHIVDHLLQRVGIEPDRKDLSGRTALEIAKQNNRQAVVKLLESHKATFVA